MEKYTPGPWKAYENKKITSDFQFVVEITPRDIIRLDASDSSSGFESCAANARLIAAAPDLVKACVTVKRFLNALEAGLPEDDPLRESRKKFHAILHEALDAALKKAEIEV